MNTKQQQTLKQVGFEIVKVGADFMNASKYNKSTRAIFQIAANYCRTISPMYDILDELKTEAANNPTVDDLANLDVDNRMFMPECNDSDCE